MSLSLEELLGELRPVELPGPHHALVAGLIGPEQYVREMKILDQARNAELQAAAQQAELAARSTRWFKFKARFFSKP